MIVFEMHTLKTYAWLKTLHVLLEKERSFLFARKWKKSLKKITECEKIINKDDGFWYYVELCKAREKLMLNVLFFSKGQHGPCFIRAAFKD